MEGGGLITAQIVHIPQPHASILWRECFKCSSCGIGKRDPTSHRMMTSMPPRNKFKRLLESDKTKLDMACRHAWRDSQLEVRMTGAIQPILSCLHSLRLTARFNT